jgi:hypothetical protein
MPALIDHTDAVLIVRMPRVRTQGETCFGIVVRNKYGCHFFDKPGHADLSRFGEQLEASAFLFRQTND